jgi:O-antigen/teichoic acid export membrane protein
MKKKYTKNYIYIYLWQFLSILISVLSAFIVLPKISNNQFLYGIYSLCISISFYVFYLDFGFISSASRFAGEYFAKGEREKEIKIISFSLFIFFIFITLFSALIFLVSYNPSLIIKNLHDEFSLIVAKKLLIVCSFSLFLNILSKFINLVLDIRLENFIFYRLYIFGNILKIFSVYYFFSNYKENIVGYYIFYQIVDFLVYLITILNIRKRYNYNFFLLLKFFRFSKESFFKLKDFARPSFLAMIVALLTFELDIFFIGKFFGVKEIAFYSIALVVFRFIWLIKNNLQGPVYNRLNHFFSINDFDNLKTYSLNTINFFMPILLFPTIIIIIFAKPLIFTWVGNNYFPSIKILQYLLLSAVFSFIYLISETILNVFKKNNIRQDLQILYLFLYLLVFFLTIKNLGINSFAFSKFLSMIFIVIINFHFCLKLLNIKLKEIFLKCFKGMIFPILFLIIISILFKDYLPLEKSKKNFIFVVLSGAVIFFVATIIYYFNQKDFRDYINKNFIFKKLKD